MNSKIYIQRTEGEWKQINRKIRAAGKKDIHSYLRCEISRLISLYNDCQPCITPASGEVRKIRHKIPEDVYEKLLVLSNLMKKPVSTIIDDFIVNPLLQPDKDAAL